MNSSRTQSRPQQSAASTVNAERKITPIQQLKLDLDRRSIIPGSFNDCFVIRAILVDAIKQSGKTRVAIAEEMTLLVGRQITERMLNAFTAESKEDSRWPAELDRAFCEVTGDARLLACRIEQAGLHVITDDEKYLLELGRQFLIRNQADEQIALLERRLRGVAL
jgi:hypothetical protein